LQAGANELFVPGGGGLGELPEGGRM